MIESLSVREQRRRLLPLLQEGCLDFSCLLIAADLIEDREPARAAFLRCHPDVWGILHVLPAGCWRCREVERRWRSAIHRYAAACYASRRDRVTYPAVDVSPETGVTRLADTEVAAMVTQSPVQTSTSAPWPYVLALSMRHCRRLVDRGLAGEHVPPDIERGLAKLRQDLCVLLYHHHRMSDEKGYDREWGIRANA